MARYLKVTQCCQCPLSFDDRGNVCSLKIDETKITFENGNDFPKWCPLLTLEQLEKSGEVD